MPTSLSGHGLASVPLPLGRRDQNRAESTGRQALLIKSGPLGQLQRLCPRGRCPLWLRGTHVALAHKQVLGGSLSSCAAQVLTPAELFLLET